MTPAQRETMRQADEATGAGEIPTPALDQLADLLDADCDAPLGRPVAEAVVELGRMLRHLMRCAP